LHEAAFQWRVPPGRVKLLQNDGGPEFKGVVALRARLFCDRHRVARPYKKNEQAHLPRGRPKVLTAHYEKNASAGANTNPVK